MTAPQETISTRAANIAAGVPGQSRPSLLASDVVIWVSIASATLPSIYGNEWKLATALGSVYLSDLLLAMAVMIGARYVKLRSIAEVLLGLLILGVTVGVVRGAALSWVVRDSRPLAYLIAGFILGGYVLARAHTIRFGITVGAWLVGVTTGLALIGQIFLVRLVGNDSALVNAVYYNGVTRVLSSSRVQTEPVALALLVVCTALASVVMKTSWDVFASRAALAVLVSSSLILTVLSYSRNSILGMAVALTIAVIGAGVLSRVTRFARAVFTVLGGAILFGIPIWIGYQNGLFGNVVDTFSSRVLGGIAPDVLGSDPSVGWRFTETRAVLGYTTDNPLWGSGFGTFYRSAGLLGDPFRSDDGRIYVHNYFLLILLKFGIVLGIGLLLFVATTVTRLLRTARTSAGVPQLAVLAPLACGFAGMLATALVTPALHARSFAVIAGLIICLGYTRFQRPRLDTAG